MEGVVIWQHRLSAGLVSLSQARQGNGSDANIGERACGPMHLSCTSGVPKLITFELIGPLSSPFTFVNTAFGPFAIPTPYFSSLAWVAGYRTHTFVERFYLEQGSLITALLR
jgi:hypothetical protein